MKTVAGIRLSCSCIVLLLAVEVAARPDVQLRARRFTFASDPAASSTGAAGTSSGHVERRPRSAPDIVEERVVQQDGRSENCKHDYSAAQWASSLADSQLLAVPLEDEAVEVILERGGSEASSNLVATPALPKAVAEKALPPVRGRKTGALVAASMVLLFLLLTKYRVRRSSSRYHWLTKGKELLSTAQDTVASIINLPIRKINERLGSREYAIGAPASLYATSALTLLLGATAMIHSLWRRFQVKKKLPQLRKAQVVGLLDVLAISVMILAAYGLRIGWKSSNISVPYF